MKLLEAIRMPGKFLIVPLIVVTVALGLLGRAFFFHPSPGNFNGRRAYAHVTAQMELGPRVTGSAASAAAGNYIADQLKIAGWSVEFQPFVYQSTPV
ncbi:MAG: Peptidase protein, partial [Anaerolineales bacterium]|nr:Peptidase protein [Anaerolineales bacterium]